MEKRGLGFRVAIIDDLAACRREIQDCLSRYFQENYAGEAPAVETYPSGEGFLKHIAEGAYDMVFIDQYMGGLSGIETARIIREADKFVALIFVTTSRDHAVDSYGVRACGYLVKPYSYDDFARTMELAGMEKIRSARFIRVEGDKILLREILWCDRDGHYMQIHTDRRGVLRFRLPFSELSALLAPYPQFMACYKGCIVNLERTQRMDDLDFVLDTGEKVPFSKRDKKKIETLYHAYLFDRERGDRLL